MCVCVCYQFDSPYFPGCRILLATHTHTHTNTHTPNTLTHTGSARGPAVLMKQPVSSYLHYIQSSGQCQQLHCSFPLSEHTHVHTHRHTQTHTHTDTHTHTHTDTHKANATAEVDDGRSSCFLVDVGLMLLCLKPNRLSPTTTSPHHHTQLRWRLSLSVWRGGSLGAREEEEERGGGAV